MLTDRLIVYHVNLVSLCSYSFIIIIVVVVVVIILLLGSFAHALGTKNCEKCEIGNNQTKSGQDSCKPCPIGYVCP